MEEKKLTDEVVAENAITDEEYVKILAHCTGLQACHNCEYNDGCPIDNETTVDLIHRLQGENEAWKLKSKELETAWEISSSNEERLQKQVDELLNRRIEPKIFQCHADTLETCPKVEKAVKGTAEKFAEMASRAFIGLNCIDIDEWNWYQKKIDEICKEITGDKV